MASKPPSTPARSAEEVRWALLAQTQRGRLRGIKKLRRPPRRRPPARAENTYRSSLHRELVEVAQALRRALLAALPELVVPLRADAARHDGENIIRRLIAQIRARFAGRDLEHDTLLDRVVDLAADHTRREWVTDVDDAIGVRPELAEPWLEELRRGFARDNARLITSVREDFMTEVEDRVAGAVAAGQRAEDLELLIREKILGNGYETDIAKARRRATLIARDQVGKLTSQLAQARQEALGVKRYRWRTSRDERVRSSHQERNGQVFEWGRPIEEQLREKGLRVDRIDGPPGIPIRCRCTAEAVLEDLVPGLPTIGEGPAGPALTRAGGPVFRARLPARPPRKVRVPEKPDLSPHRTMPRTGRPVQLSDQQLQADRTSVWLEKSVAARRVSTYEERRTWMLWQWVHGSNRKTAVLIKRAVIAELRNELGLEGEAFQRYGARFRHLQEDLGRARGDVRRLWTETQALLEGQGTLRLYRGVKDLYNSDGSVEAWTDDPEIARKFAGPGGRVIVEDVPVSRILVGHRSPSWLDGTHGRQNEWLVMR